MKSSEAAHLFGVSLYSVERDATANCDDIDPYERHRHTSRCGYALKYSSEVRQVDETTSVPYGENQCVLRDVGQLFLS
jgi:hypothetical protein